MKKLIVMFLLAVASSAAHADQPSLHGMVLFGEQKLYASHLPMFQAPHDYQAILEISLKPVGDKNAVAEYEQAKKQGGLFTLLSVPMDLSSVVSGSSKDFKASIYKGHFEKGGEKLGDVLVHVQKVVLGSKLMPSPTAPQENKYLVFGGKGEYFAAHLIESQPSLDAIVSIDQVQAIKDGVCHARYCPEPESMPVDDQKLPLTLQLGESVLTPPKAASSLFDYVGHSADVQSVLYESDEDLKK